MSFILGNVLAVVKRIKNINSIYKSYKRQSIFLAVFLYIYINRTAVKFTAVPKFFHLNYSYNGNFKQSSFTLSFISESFLSSLIFSIVSRNKVPYLFHLFFFHSQACNSSVSNLSPLLIGFSVS